MKLLTTTTDLSHRLTAAIAFSVSVVCNLGPTTAAQPEQHTDAKESSVLNTDKLSAIDAAIETAIKEKKFPGAIVVVSRRGQVVFNKTFGNRALTVQPEPMTKDTIFDMASLTKVMATATSIMILIDQNKIKLQDPVVKYVPQFAPNGKDKITIEQLLRHRGGLIPDNALSDYLDGPERAMERIYNLKTVYEPGTSFRYTDVGYILLGEVVRRVSGMPLNEFARSRIFEPLGMSDTRFQLSNEQKTRTAPTEKRNGKWMRGEVHDPRSYELGGVAGHAGLFSSSRDVMRFAQTMLNFGSFEDKQILSPEAVRLMTSPGATTGRQLRGLGWDINSPYSSPRGNILPIGGFGHTGFTGPSLWIDPASQLVIMILTNRVHPDGKGNAVPIRRTIADIVARSLPETKGRKANNNPTGVQCGIDILQAEDFKRLQGQRVGLITNHTGLNRTGQSTIDLLFESPNVNLVALFSPEHGIRGILDSAVNDSRDTKTGLPIYSLYGKSRKPNSEQLTAIDALVFDIQDIGCRFYTYSATLGLTMESAAENGIRYYVLDRPNPIGGIGVEGPVLDSGLESFTGYHTIPVRHGMTLGELALMYQREKPINVELEIIKLTGWRREHLLEQTSLYWTNPSPNMRSSRQALLYPGIGLLETTNISVGRGTDTPFEIIGAPWINGRALANAMRNEPLAGVVFTPTRFTPDASVHKDKPCEGIEIVVTNRKEFQSVATGLAIARQLRSLYPNGWKIARFNRLLVDKMTFENVSSTKPLREIVSSYSPELNEFRNRRSSCLLYE